MSRKLLLVCGILSSLLYVITDITGALQWQGYSYLDQTISELAALDAPSRPTVLVMFTFYNVLLMVFAAGIMTSSVDRRLQTAANALGGIGAIGLVAALFPIQQRGAVFSMNETMHSVLTIATVICIVIAIAAGARAAGQRFYRYSLATIAVSLFFGAAAGANGPQLAQGLATPWLGVIERLSVFSYLAWVAVFAVVLMRKTAAPARLRVRGHHASDWHGSR
jgi:hypothetical protein